MLWPTLLWGNIATYPLHKHFSATTWQAVHSRFLQRAKNLGGTHSSDLRHTLYLDGAKTIKVDGRVTNTELTEDIGVPRKWKIGIHTALHEHADAADGLQL